MRNLVKGREIAVGGAPSEKELGREVSRSTKISALMRQISSSLPSAELTYGAGSRSVWVYYPQGLLRRPESEWNLFVDSDPQRQRFPPHPCVGCKGGFHEEKEAKEEEGSHPGHSLFQESFFLCTVKKFGDVLGAGCIYVEVVVDRDSRASFAKVYSARNALNAVDIVASRVVPFFERRGAAIQRIDTRKTSEYCGLPPAHPFETFLMTSHIQHGLVGQPEYSPCEDFYQVLQRDFFSAAVRKQFHLSLDELQKELDAFVETYNSKRIAPSNAQRSPAPQTESHI
jgi:transposase InsO family protein